MTAATRALEAFRQRVWARLWPRRLHQQLVLLTALLMLLALSVLGVYTAQSQTALALEGAMARQATLAHHLALSCGNLILTDSFDEVEELARRTAEFPDVRDVAVLDASGRVLTRVRRTKEGQVALVVDRAHATLPVPGPTHPRLTEVRVENQDRVVAWQPVMAGAVVGWVRLEQGLDALAPVHNRILWSTGVVGLLAVALSTLLLMWRVRPAMQALDRAARFAVGLSHTEGQQLPVPAGPHEIHQLTQALNLASRRLSRQLHDIQTVMRQLEFHETQLSHQNEQLQALFSLSPDGLAIFDDNGLVTFANDAFFRLTGLGPDEVLDHREDQLSEGLRRCLVDDAGWTGLAALESLGLAGGQAVAVRGEVPRVLQLSVQASTLPSVSRVVLVADMTRQHQLDQMKSEFLSMAAHELRTPMASIFGFTELMLRREMPLEQRQDLLGRMHRQSQLMINILNELLDLARIESRRGQDFDLRSLDLVPWLSAYLAEHAPPSGRQPVLMHPSSSSRPAMPVCVDVGKLRQALGNVLSNAYKYSPDGGPVAVRLVQAGEPDADEFGIEVRDEGMGLKPEELARLGERFFRADKSGHIPGTGLGVSIVRELLGLMGGRMEVQSQFGKGTVVTLWLPATEAEAQPA